MTGQPEPAVIDITGRYVCCGAPARPYFCDIDGCRSTVTAHVPGYPDCVNLCPEHRALHDSLDEGVAR